MDALMTISLIIIGIMTGEINSFIAAGLFSISMSINNLVETIDKK